MSSRLATASGEAKCRPRYEERGMALLLVIWVLALLSLLAAGLTVAARSEAVLVRNREQSAQAQAIAEAGVSLAILGLLEIDPAAQWRGQSAHGASRRALGIAWRRASRDRSPARDAPQRSDIAKFRRRRQLSQPVPSSGGFDPRRRRDRQRLGLCPRDRRQSLAQSGRAIPHSHVAARRLRKHSAASARQSSVGSRLRRRRRALVKGQGRDPSDTG
jgi:hypothetical protein